MEGCEARRWVEIGFTVLEPAQRTARLPEDTTRVPYEARVRGFAVGACRLGDEVEVKTLTGRRVRGRVVALDPCFAHDFGRPVLELIEESPSAAAACARGGAIDSEAAAADRAGGEAQA